MNKKKSMIEVTSGADSESRKKPARPITAPSQYLFATDNLFEESLVDGSVKVRNRFQWILTNINFTIGLGPLWRFPVVAHRLSGGAFVFVYTLVFVFVGYPLALLEVALGQSTRRRAATVFKLCTALEGLSICMGIYSFLIPIYYNVLFSYAIFYFYQSFWPKLPWSECNPEWGMPDQECYDSSTQRKENVTYAASQELFWIFRVLGGFKSPSTVQLHQLNNELVVCLAISWTLVAILLVHKIRKYTFSVEYVLIPFMATAIIIVIVLSVTVVGKTARRALVQALVKFFVPTVEIFKNIQIWREATQQVFFSLGVASGPLITLGSLSHFKSPIHMDSAIVCVINFAFSIVGGVAVFYCSTLLTLELERNSPVAREIELYGCGVFFIGFSKLVCDLPVPQLWSTVFFFLLFCLGSRAVMGSIDTTVSVLRHFLPHLRTIHVTVLFAGAVVVIVSFLFGLFAITEGDTVVFVILDKFGGGTTLPILAAVECICVAWIYGVTRFSGDLDFMLDFKPNFVIKAFWVGIPIYLIVLVLLSWIHAWIVNPFKGVVPGPYVTIGWLIVVMVICPLPLRFLSNCIDLYRRKRIKEIFKSRDDVGPDELELRYKDENFFDRISVLMPTSTSN